MRLSGTVLGYLVAGAIAAGEGALGVVLAPYLQANGFPVPAIGAFVAVYAVAGLLSRLPGGRWYRPGWIRPLLAASLLLQCAVNVAFPFFVAGLPLVILRLLGGFSYGLCTTINLAQFIDTLPPERSRDRAMGYFTGALSVGFMLGNITAGFLADHFGFGAGFVGVAIYPLLAAIATPFAVEPRTVRGARPGAAGPRALLRAIGEPLLLVVLVEAFLLHFLFGMHYALLPLYLLAVGATLAELGILRGLFSATQVASRIGTSWLTSRFGHRRVAASALVGQIVALALMPTTGNVLALTALSMAFGGARGIMLVANTLGMAESSDRGTVGRGASSGVFNAANDLGILVGPLVAGGVAGLIGIANTFAAVPLGVLAVYVACLWLNARRPRAAARVAE